MEFVIAKSLTEQAEKFEAFGAAYIPVWQHMGYLTLMVMAKVANN